MSTDQSKLDEFRVLCEQHDLTYMYSDDGGSYRAGAAQKQALKLFAAQYLTREEANKIWNEVVDTKMAEGFRSPFYWS